MVRPTPRKKPRWGSPVRGALARLSALLLATATALVAWNCSGRTHTPYTRPRFKVLEIGGTSKDLAMQTSAQVRQENSRCVKCHEGAVDPHKDHYKDEDDPNALANALKASPLACVDCHGGNPAAETKDEAHPRPRFPERWLSSANPERTYTLLNDESWEWIRFINPGDLRVANATCGPCHADIVLAVSKSLMTNAAHFWGTAGYSNGILPLKRSAFGESYSPEGIPQRVHTVWDRPDEKAMDLKRGVIETIDPLPHWEITQPGNIFRVFEQGSRLGGPALGLNGSPTSLVGLPDKLEDPGRPNNRLSDRGLGTLNRVDLPLLNIHKTRLNDPFLSFLGTNDNPGDFRSSGCTACHVLYANDRSAVHSGPSAKHGNRGLSDSKDPTIPKNEPGHPIQHRFTTSIPSSQCMVCHMHQPNAFLNSFYGFQMWTYETDGELLWPPEEEKPSNEEYVSRLDRNPEEAATRGLWGDPEFLADVSSLNPKLKQTQFADYHGHGWIFRAVFKMDRKGNLLDRDGQAIPYNDPAKFEGVVPRFDSDHPSKDGPPQVEPQPGKAVHLKDIHAEKGMHCVDCHFKQDVHGNQKLYAEYQAAIEITCEDCHGTVLRAATLTPGGPAALSASRPSPIRSFLDLETPFGKPRFEKHTDGTIIQHSMIYPGLQWNVPQVRDSVDPSKPERYNERAARAKTIRRDGDAQGPLPENEEQLAHGSDQMTCQSCHTSWITSCFGCHLSQKANMRTPMHHFETKELRNFASYNPQVARDDVFMLGISPDVQKNRISTVRSSSAVLISSEDGQRQRIYGQIPTMAANGMSSQAFNTHFAHTVRKTETRKCDDCHVSAANDNNAWLAQVLLLGTGFVNFFGQYAYVGSENGGFDAVRVTEWDEPQAVIGSYLHKLAYPRAEAEHEARGRELKDAVHVPGGDIRSLQLRGEYLYTAGGQGGFRVFDVANVGNKGFSERIVTSPVSPLGQDTHVPTRFATAVALATNNPVSMSRAYREENRETPYVYRGRTQNLHEVYRYAFITDREEGLILVDVDCLSDGDPRNNFLERSLTFNPGGLLTGAESLAVAGTTVYVCSREGLSAIDVADPLQPRVLATVRAPDMRSPRAVAVQFRYAFVCDEDGVKVLDITFPERMSLKARVELPGARDLYVARTYGYVAAGPRGLVILDLERPESPIVLETWDAGGRVNDLRQVKVGMTNDSVFAYMADGKNGLRIAQLISPEDADKTARSAYGFSPRPAPKLLATYATSRPALALSRGLDRDRASDESGNQMAVFGRIGGRPLSQDEMKRLYLRQGEVYRVSNEAESPSEPGTGAGAPGASRKP